MSALIPGLEGGLGIFPPEPLLCRNGLHQLTGEDRCRPCYLAKRARKRARVKANRVPVSRCGRYRDESGNVMPPRSGRCGSGRHEKDYAGPCRLCHNARQRRFCVSEKVRAVTARCLAKKAGL